MRHARVQWRVLWLGMFIVLVLSTHGTVPPLPAATVLTTAYAATTPDAIPTQLPTYRVESASCPEYTYPEYSPEPPVFPIITETETTRTIGGGTFGDVIIPKNPQRIFAGDELSLDVLLSLGIKPVGTIGDPQGKLPRQFDGRVDGVTVLPGWEPDPEAILELKPDLIIYMFVLDEGIYQNLSKIAPTLNPQTLAFNWRRVTQDMAVLVERSEQAAQMIADYEATKAAASDQLPVGLREECETMAVIFTNPRGLRLYGVGAPVEEGVLYATNVSEIPYFDLRLTPPSIIRDHTQLNASGYVDLSLEALPQLDDADHVLLYIGDPNKTAEIENHPLWKALPAVQNGKVYKLPFDSLAIGGPVIMRQRLDEFVALVSLP
jgi:iron complex transport system substrate-binding protein